MFRLEWFGKFLPERRSCGLWASFQGKPRRRFRRPPAHGGCSLAGSTDCTGFCSGTAALEAHGRLRIVVVPSSLFLR